MRHPILTNECQEELDNLMQKGYSEMMKNNSVAASVVWLDLWEKIKETMSAYEIPYIEDMDEAFHGEQNIYNWSTDLETELHNASKEDNRFLQHRIDLCREYIAKSKQKDDYNNLVRRRAIAESYIKLGHFDEGIKLFEEFVDHYPEDAWGWINWSDQYGLFAEDQSHRDFNKAISILKTGLEVPELDYREDVLMRLEEMYSELDMKEKAHDVRQEIESINRKNVQHLKGNIRNLGGKLDAFPSGKPVSRKKIGRNEPCPCGSGKKYKKCCGA